MDGVPDRDVETLLALLEWHLEMGADWVLDASPHDRFAEYGAERASSSSEAPAASPDPGASPATLSESGTRSLARLPAASTPGALGPDRTMSIEAAERSARELAAACHTLTELRAALEGFEGCALKRSATRMAFCDGVDDARIMFVGEAPGAEEDRTGRPFVGRAGQLLDRMMAAIGLDRTKVYIANVVPWRPPGNRTPTPQEVAICMPFLRRQISLVNPDILVALGGASAQALFGLSEGIMRTRGSWRSYETEAGTGTRFVKAIATLHPAYLLRSPAAKRLAWRDLRQISNALAGGSDPEEP